MRVSARLPDNLVDVSSRAREMEQRGISELLSFEVSHDPFAPLLLAAEHTENARLMTAIAVAFGRSPMTTAMIAHDINSFSRGRFTLGLGTQIKAHITRRFSMPWSNPVARIREYVAALHAIWDCWYDGKPLCFEGEFYRHTLMTPVMSPKDTGFGRPGITLAAVGPDMCRTAAEVADGVILHSFTTPAYIRDVIMPAINDGLAKRGVPRSSFDITLGPFIVTGANPSEFEASRRTACERVAFYGSTPAYRRVLEHHGWGDLQAELWRLSKAGKWQQMGDLIDDRILNTFAIVAEPEQVAEAIEYHFGEMVDCLNIDTGSLPTTTFESILTRFCGHET